MNKAILKRIEALEARKQAEPKPASPIPLAVYLVALFAGRWQPNESPADAYYRGLGLERANQFHALSPDQASERHRNAMRRIFKRRGIDLDTASRDEIDAVLMKLVKKLAKSGMPVPDSSWVPVAA
jgi:hypothetical protein